MNDLAGADGQIRRRSVILTTDCGADMDDQWALAHLALCPELRLAGVVATHAPNLPAPAAASAAQFSREVLEYLPSRVRPTVIVGSNGPLGHDRSGASSGADFLIDRAHGHTTADRLLVLVAGAATDVAAALLRDETLGDRIEIVAMAFDGWPDSDDSFNVRNDPLAWRILLESRASIVVGDAAVTGRDLGMSRERAQRLLGDCPPAGPYLVGLLVGWLEAHSDLVRQVTGDATVWPVWDQVLVAHLLGMTTVETHQRPALRDDLSFDHEPDTGQTIDWITAIDADRLWADLRLRLATASDLTTGQRSTADDCAGPPHGLPID